MNHRSRGLTWAFKAALISTIFTIAGCGSDPVDIDENQLPEALFGGWQWVRATGGIAGQVRTPETEGFTRTLLITSPDQVELRRDGQTEVLTTFEFMPEMEAGSAARSAQLIYALPLLGFSEQWVEITEEGLLVLVDSCCDGFVYEWRRATIGAG